jgi:uncharacterized protein YceH (UPF0502 family)
MPPVELAAAEARVLGCLIEKQLTTPDVYPMSLNSLRVACNQTTNRDPIVSYDEATVEHALEGLRAKQLSGRTKAHNERVVKHRQIADETLEINPAERALLCVLMLRGPHTLNELKTRTERLHGFASTDAVETSLHELAERDFVVLLVRRPGQREVRWAQLLTGPPSEAVAGAAGSAVAPAPASPTAIPPGTEITDDVMRAAMQHSRTYTLVVLREGPNRNHTERQSLVWAHGRRNFELRRDGKLAIVGPVRDETELDGIGIFTTDEAETRELMDADPGVQAGIFVYDVHPVTSFPGDALP